MGVFSVQPTGKFVHVFTLFDLTIELLVFDCWSPYSFGHFNIHDESEKFIRMLVGYDLMNDNELNLDIFIEHDSQYNSIIIQEDTTRKVVKI